MGSFQNTRRPPQRRKDISPHSLLLTHLQYPSRTSSQPPLTLRGKGPGAAAYMYPVKVLIRRAWLRHPRAGMGRQKVFGAARLPCTSPCYHAPGPPEPAGVGGATSGWHKAFSGSVRFGRRPSEALLTLGAREARVEDESLGVGHPRPRPRQTPCVGCCHCCC